MRSQSMTQSIEETWEGLTQHQPCVDEECPLCKAEEDAARALALAVLEEARTKADTRQHGNMQGRGIRFGILRRRIEELGR